MRVSLLLRWILTCILIVCAAVYAYDRYKLYLTDPWTRDGMVQADVLDIKSPVSGTVQTVLVQENGFVQQGDMLFQLDPVLFQAAFSAASAALLQATEQLESAKKHVLQTSAAAARTPSEAHTAAQQQAQLALSAAKAAHARLSAESVQAKLALEATLVRAPAAGYVVNLNIVPGSLVSAYTPLMALIIKDSFRIEAFFRESLLAEFAVGDAALVTLMAYPAHPLTGKIESIGRGISRQNGSPGPSLLPQVSPTFEWIRLAQRLPVRIRLDSLPSPITLRVGMTASVLVQTPRSH